MTPAFTLERFDTPMGELSVFASDDGVVCAAGFQPPAQVASRLPADAGGRGWCVGKLPRVEDAVSAWLDGDGAAIATVPVRQAGGPFFHNVWEVTRAIPMGEPMSYQDVAAAAGRPRAMRAAGTACGHNSIGLFVPCHRVISARGRLGQYGTGGLGIKAGLLAFEAGWSDSQVQRAVRDAHPDCPAPAIVVKDGDRTVTERSR